MLSQLRDTETLIIAMIIISARQNHLFFAMPPPEDTELLTDLSKSA